MRKPSRSAAKRPGAFPAPDTATPLIDEDGLKRVSSIIQNARATWFALLGALVFASVTLASVKDLSFFVNTVETKLPLVGISVPVNSFFWAGSLLIAAIYAYFHLYLELLWQALGKAPARIGGKPLADRIDPWIVADSALRLRDWLREAKGEQRASCQRSMPQISGFVSFGLVWLFGTGVILWFWLRSMPAHDLQLTGVNGIVLIATLWVFCTSLTSAHNYLADSEIRWRWRPVFSVAMVAVVGLTLVWTWIDPWAGQPRETVFYACDARQIEAGRRFCPGNIRIDWLRPAIADLREVVFTEKPKDWQSKEIAETEFRARWCKERGKPECANPLDPTNRKFESDLERPFQAAWKERWAAQLASFLKPNLKGRDFRGADMTLSAFEGADFNDVTLNGAVLSFARLDGADLSDARLSGVALSGARLDGANLSLATLDGANLSGAKLDGAYLGAASLLGADLSNASLDGADLIDARLDSATLTGAHLQDALLSGAVLVGATLGGARLDGADLSGARMFGMRTELLDLSSASLISANFHGSGFRFAKVSAENLAQVKEFLTSFGDASVSMPPGVAVPCQWGTTELSDAEYFGRWEGWASLLGDPDSYSDLGSDAYPPVAPPPGCVPPPAEP
jgi:uncharacterized protein YjbI with pentapeptide repeats